MSIEIRGERTDDPDGDLDEIVASNVNVHFERMSDSSFALVITDGSREVIAHFSASRKRISAFIFEDSEAEKEDKS